MVQLMRTDPAGYIRMLSNPSELVKRFGIEESRARSLQTTAWMGEPHLFALAEEQVQPFIERHGFESIDVGTGASVTERFLSVDEGVFTNSFRVALVRNL